jgi:U3 small nucleolar RNA-associated protein 14
MPPRIARSHAAASAPKASKASKINKGKKRQLDAFAIASHEAPEKLQIRQHRLGESFGEHPRAKRRRLQDDDEDSEGEEKIDSAPLKQSRNLEKRTHGRKGGLDDENVEFGSDSEGNEWTMGGMGSEESDEEIDSDEAFGESDEERFDGWTFRGSKSEKGKPKKKVVKPKKQVDDDGDLDLNEDDEEEEDDEDEDSDFGGEGVDLATMLDDHDDDVLGGKDNTRKDFGEESASDEESSEGDDEQSDSSSDEEDEEPEDDERHARLQDFVDALDSKPADERERIVSGEDGGLTVDDLLADTELDKATMATFKPKRKSKAPQTLAAPLPKRQQDKIDREIATQKANEQLDRWRDTVMQNRRAEFLSFPLKRSDENQPIGKDKFIPAQEEKPRTELEASIQKIMEESGMATKKDGPGKAEDPESDLLKAEELALNKMPVEEMLRRRAELRQNRELLFREEAKAKRISKIKSKSYRRVHRKQRERDAEKERALLDPEGLGIPMDEDEKELADRRRAEARMGAKHKDSKWAKSLKATNRDVWDEGAREGALEQARRQEELKKRVAGRDVSDGSSDDSDDDDSDDGDNSGTLKKLEKLRGGEAPEKGIGAMKFMRDADARKKAKNDEALDALRKELAGMQSDEEDKEEENLGRAIFGPSKQNDKPAPKPKRPEMEEGDLSEDENEKPADAEKPATAEKRDRRQPNNKGNKASGPLAAKSQVPDRRAQEDNEEDSADQPNPWLAGPTKSKKSKADKQAQRDDDTTLVSLNEPMAKSKPAPKQKSTEPSAAVATEASAPSNGGWQTVPYNNNNDASSPEPETENPMLSAADQKAALYARAFAGDDVKSAFDAEKADQAHSEDEKTVSTAMPGWGAWAGAGMSKSMKKTANRARHNPLHKHKVPGVGVSQDKRKDKRLENVIVSEKSDRKGKKYLAPVLPHGFERGDEYERSLRQPIGKEWGTKEVVQRNTRPRVVVKPGAVIEAMERPLL